MILRKGPHFNLDIANLLEDRQDIAADMTLIRATFSQLEQFPLLGEVWKGNIRRRYLPRLRAHLYYQYFPRARRIDLLRLWPAYRDEVG